MPSCVFRKCTNYDSKVNKTQGISYHMFPRPGHENREIWIKYVQKNRSEVTWLPSIFSRMCSVHFKEEDKYVTKSGRIYLKKTAVPCVNYSGPSPGPSSCKRQLCRPEQNETKPLDADSDDDDEEDEHDDTNDKTEHECNLELSRRELQGRAPSSYKCNVCSADIQGFRYTCLQCVDWDMCMACEMRGEHPEHYVLRSPALSTYAETGQVLAVIRKHIEDLLKLSKEMTETETSVEEEITVKEEMIEEELENVLVASHSIPAMSYRSVPEVDELKEGQSEYIYIIRNSLPTGQGTINSSTHTHPVQNELQSETIVRHFVNETSVPIEFDQSVSQDNQSVYNHNNEENSVTTVPRPLD